LTLLFGLVLGKDTEGTTGSETLTPGPVQKRGPAMRGSSPRQSKKIGCPAYLHVVVLVADPEHAHVYMRGTHTHRIGSLATPADLWCRMMAPPLQDWILQSFEVVTDLDVIFRLLNEPGSIVPPGTPHHGL
jgi:hypothetical protein